MCMCGPFEQTILYSNDLVSTQIMSERKRLSTESTAFSFLIHSSFLNFVKSLLLFSLFFSFYDPVYFFMISSSKILCGFTTLLQNTYPYQVAILKNRPLFFLPVPSLTMSVCDSHAQWATVHCWLGDERWTETSHTPLAYSLPPSLVSLSVLSSLSCCRPCWAVIWQMLKTLFFFIFTVFLLICKRACVCACAREQVAPGCMRVLWPACNVWSRIHLVHLHFVCLSQPSICCWGESWVWWSCHGWPAGCCLSPCLDDHTLTLGEQHRHPRFLSPAHYCIGAV